MKAKDRIEELTGHALAEAEQVGFLGMTRDGIAARACVSQALVTLKLGTMNELRRRVMRAAIAKRNMRVLAEGLAGKDKQAVRMPDDLKREVALWLAQQ